MKPFTTDDLFKAMRLLKHSGIKEKVKDLLSGIADGKEVDLERIGLDAIIEAVYAFAEEGCQRELYDLLSGPWEMSAEEIGKLPLSELYGKLEETAKSEDLRDFFTQLAKLISMKP